MIELKKITKSYDSRENVLSDLSATIPTGSLSLLYGRSGSGKTTLLNCISGVESLQSGNVHIKGEHINALSDDEKADFRLRNIGIIYQFFNLLPSLTVRENILLPAMILKKNQEDYLLEIAKRFEISQLLSKWPETLSGGECQRVAICRALICKPKLILADEPTGNLDIRNRDIVMNYLKDLTKSQDLSLIIATHDQELYSFSDSIWSLRSGQLQQL
tara:strand:- start:54 stop:704 length:651 start_codon:yes stop_codon:yes gene_type:complete